MKLTEHFLIAMPHLQDPFFKRSVVYICEHSEEGAMGLIINKPVKNLTVAQLLKQINILPRSSLSEKAADLIITPVLSGGPLAKEQGFVLHSAERHFATSIPVSQDKMITTSRDILTTLGTPQQPSSLLVTLGYCSWDKYQLEKELKENVWLTAPASDHILFDSSIDERWRTAASDIGIDMCNIVSEAGHA